MALTAYSDIAAVDEPGQQILCGQQVHMLVSGVAQEHGDHILAGDRLIGGEGAAVAVDDAAGCRPLDRGGIPTVPGHVGKPSGKGKLRFTLQTVEHGGHRCAGEGPGGVEFLISNTLH